jgi:hypothetical protein
VTRVLATLLFLLVIGMAAAQPPVDYILLCDDVVIGTARYVGGGFDVAVLEGAEECAEVRALSVVGDGVLAVSFAWPGGILTVTLGEMWVVAATVVPQPALYGMVGAAENRAAAGELAGQGQETAARDRAERQPELPDVAGDGQETATRNRAERQPEPSTLPEPTSSRRP